MNITFMENLFLILMRRHEELVNEQIQSIGKNGQPLVLEPETHSLYIHVGNRRVHLTKTEYRIFQALFRETLLSDDQLAKEVLARSQDKSVRECLDKHVDHLRRKVRVYGWEVYRVLHYGYILLREHV